MLPVLLDSLRGDWQANELARPLARLKAMDMMAAETNAGGVVSPQCATAGYVHRRCLFIVILWSIGLIVYGN